MTAFLYIPAHHDGRLSRRVDFTNIAGLFVESEEVRKTPETRRLLKLAAAAVIVIFAIGDMLLVTRPDALTAMSRVGGPPLATSGHAASL